MDAKTCKYVSVNISKVSQLCVLKTLYYSSMPPNSKPLPALIRLYSTVSLTVKVLFGLFSTDKNLDNYILRLHRLPSENLALSFVVVDTCPIQIFMHCFPNQTQSYLKSYILAHPLFSRVHSKQSISFDRRHDLKFTCPSPHLTTSFTRKSIKRSNRTLSIVFPSPPILSFFKFRV